MYRKDIMNRVAEIQLGELSGNLEKIADLVLSGSKSNRALATELLYAEGYSPFQALVINNLLLSIWGIGKRLATTKLDNQSAMLSGLYFFAKTKAEIEAARDKDPIAAHIQSKWGDCEFFQFGYNPWDEVYGIPNNQYIGFVALLDGIPLLVVNDCIEIVDNDGPHNRFLSNISICILSEIPENIPTISPLTVKIQLAHEQSALCPHWVSLEGKFDAEKEEQFETMLEAMDEVGWGMHLGIRREENELAFEELFDIEIPREEADITTKIPIEINKENLSTITNNQSFEGFTAQAELFSKTKLSSGNAVADFLYELLG